MKIIPIKDVRDKNDFALGAPWVLGGWTVGPGYSEIHVHLSVN